MLRLLLVALALSPATPERAPLVGVAAHPLWVHVSAAEARRDVAAVAATGADLVRIDAGWATLQPEHRGAWSAWALRRLDRVVSAAAAEGVRPVVTFMSSPCWAAAAPARLRRGCRGPWWQRGVQYYPPRRARDYARALAFLVRRYGDRVAAWEVWNEPNQRAFFVTRTPATDYARLLRAVARRVDHRAKILGGAVAEADLRFVESLYDKGVAGTFDALSLHPYVGDRAPDDLATGEDARYAFPRGVPAVRAVMRAHGDERPIWLTELGWNTSLRREGPRWANGVSEPVQARYLLGAFAQVRRWPYVRAAVWYSLRDRGNHPFDAAAHYGVLRADDTAKPALAALREVTGVAP